MFKRKKYEANIYILPYININMEENIMIVSIENDTKNYVLCDVELKKDYLSLNVIYWDCSTRWVRNVIFDFIENVFKDDDVSIENSRPLREFVENSYEESTYFTYKDTNLEMYKIEE